jgi:hypothetical protein
MARSDLKESRWVLTALIGLMQLLPYPFGPGLQRVKETIVPLYLSLTSLPSHPFLPSLPFLFILTLPSFLLSLPVPPISEDPGLYPTKFLEFAVASGSNLPHFELKNDTLKH